MDIAPYVPGMHAIDGRPVLHRLSSNETPLGASPRAIEAMRDIAGHLEEYPDGSAAALREAIGARYGLNANRIVCGTGSDELLNLMAQAYLGPGDEAIYSTHGFLVYKLAILSAGATPVVAPETDLTASVDAILEKVTARTKLIFLANPNNPTGTYLTASEIGRLHAALPSHVVLLIDAAYAEYVQRNDYDAGIERVATSQNVVMTRTFSKIYGLAALRIGWLYGPEHIVDALNRIRGPFNVNAAAIAAGAAAIADQKFVDSAIEHNSKWLPWVSRALEEIGLSVTPSVCNFVLVHFPDEAGRRAIDADAYLLEQGIILRQVGVYGLPLCLRMTIGSQAANHDTVAALKTFMERSV